MFYRNTQQLLSCCKDKLCVWRSRADKLTDWLLCRGGDRISDDIKNALYALTTNPISINPYFAQLLQRVMHLWKKHVWGRSWWFDVGSRSPFCKENSRLSEMSCWWETEIAKTLQSKKSSLTLHRQDTLCHTAGLYTQTSNGKEENIPDSKRWWWLRNSCFPPGELGQCRDAGQIPPAPASLESLLREGSKVWWARKQWGMGEGKQDSLRARL